MCLAWISLNSNGVGHQPVAGGGLVLGRPDQGDDRVDHVEGLEEALDDVGPVLGLARRYSERRVMTSTWWSM